MKERPSIETSTTPEDSLDLLFELYKEELADPLLNRIKSEMERSWDESNDLHKEVKARLEEFLEALRRYHDSYTGLKAAARKERSFFHDDPEKYVSGIQNADRREKILHDSFISAANILSRAMKKAEMDNNWRGDDMIYHQGGVNDSTDEPARDKFREWMFRIYHDTFSS